ncbi:MAG: hypothetical protein R3B06_08060 [Kofleriaceae bacterium]
MAEGLAGMPGFVAAAEDAIARKQYAAAINAARAWMMHQPAIEELARSMDPSDEYAARARHIVDRMRDLEPSLPEHLFGPGVPELDRTQQRAWLAKVGGGSFDHATAKAHGQADGDIGASPTTATGTITGGVNARGIAHSLIVPWFIEHDGIRRTILGADTNPLMDGVDDVLDSLIDDPVYASGFLGGAVTGCWSAIKDTARGPCDLAKLLIELQTKLALYQHREILAGLRDTIKQVPAALALLGERWNDDSNRYAQGRFQGEVVGYIGTQLALLIVTAAVEPLANLAGPYSGVIRAIAAVGDPLTAVRDVAAGVRLSDDALAALRGARRATQADHAADAARAAETPPGVGAIDDLVTEPTDGLERAIARTADDVDLGGATSDPRMRSKTKSLDGHSLTNEMAAMSPAARHVIRQLEKRGWVRIKAVNPADIVEVSKWFGKEIAVVQTPYGTLRIILGAKDGIYKSMLMPGEVFVVHTHPVMISKAEHFTKDLSTAGKATEAVIDWSGQVTYFNKTGIKNPTLPDGSIAPLLDFQASFLDADGAIIGFAKVDMVDGPTGTTIKVRE